MARKGKIDWDKEEARKRARKGKIDWDKEEARKMAIKDCQKRCPRFIGEICASDNNTYWNKCTFEIAKCEAKLYGVTLTVKNNGPCNSKHPGNYLTRIVLGGRLFILMTVTSSSSSSVPP